MDKFLFLVGEGFKNLWRFKLTTVTSIFSVFMTLYLIGILFTIGDNSQKLIVYLRSKYKIEVFFKQEISDTEARKLTQEIQKIPGIRSATNIDRADAARIFKQQFGEDILTLLETNPLPASCVVNISRTQSSSIDIAPIIAEIEKIDGVDEITFQGRLISRIERYYNLLFKILTGVAIVILLVTISIISNTIKLTFYIRADLVKALKLVGASNIFIKTPFIIDGILQGLIGALLASAALYGTIFAGNHFIAAMTNRIRISGDLFIALWLTIVAVLIGMIGASRASAKLLK
ncbi:MAG: ABC transporter permease [Candidatus Marinimicrobia bacterium]|nr:ABC transporter permease [Candidatus Neomarinimicrobiota bacterium]